MLLMPLKKRNLVIIHLSAKLCDLNYKACDANRREQKPASANYVISVRWSKKKILKFFEKFFFLQKKFNILFVLCSFTEHLSLS